MRPRLLLGIHDHQPVGNFPDVMEQAYEDAYRPFLDTLDRHPRVRVAMHHSGPLLEFIEERHPDYVDRLAAAVARGQVEPVSGAFWEPILTAIPERDRRAQIRRMNTWIQERLGVAPRGLWLAERVWEPNLVRAIAAEGISWIALDDDHLGRAGADARTVNGYYLTEDEGVPLRVFPISQELRYLIPFREPGEVVEFLRQAGHRHPGIALTFFDDGEKLGVWPGTRRLCYEEGWLDRFFGALSETDALDVVSFSDVLASDPPTGRIYLPAASYFEMGEWSLPADRAERFARVKQDLDAGRGPADARSFLQGGFWRNFLVKYPEINLLHKRMLHLSQGVRDAEDAPGADPEGVARAKDALLRSQCNCAYWHGVFGGAYLPHLRHGLWSALIDGEVALRAALGLAPATVHVEERDLEVDGRPVVQVETGHLAFAVKPGEGGALLYLDDRAARFALMNTLSRRREGYHPDLLPADPVADGAETDNIHHMKRRLPGEARLVYDWYRHLAFQDHFLSQEVSADAWLDQRSRDIGDFVLGAYGVMEAVPAGAGEGPVEVLLRREGNLWLHAGEPLPLRVDKRFRFPSGRERRIEVAWRVTNTGDREVDAVMAVEWTLKMLTDLPGHRGYRVDGARERLPLAPPLDGVRARSIAIEDDDAGIAVVLDADEDVTWTGASLRTCSQSEGGVDVIYQGTTVLALRPLRLGPGETRGLRHALSLEGHGARA